MESNELTDIRAEIAEERRELAGIFAALPERAWDAPTLCAGWRVREVVAHMTMPFRYTTAWFVLDLLAAGGNFARMSNRAARRGAATLSATELAASVADNTEHPWKPPVGGYGGALTHDVVHGLDITVPLGIDRRVPENRLRVVLEGMSTPRGLRHFGVDLRGVQLRADDLDWTFGAGTPLCGAGQDLLLVLGGRRLPAGRLRGEPSARFTTG